MVYSEEYYETLVFLAGFGAVGALGCESVMEEERPLSTVSRSSENLVPHNREDSTEQLSSLSERAGRLETSINE